MRTRRTEVDCLFSEYIEIEPDYDGVSIYEVSMIKLVTAAVATLAIATIASAQSLHDANKIICNIGPATSQQKSMSASCSASPESAFSSRYKRQDARDHCSVTPMNEASAYRNFEINVTLKLVTWNFEFIADPITREALIEDSMERNDLTREEAQSRFDENTISRGLGRISSISAVNDKIFHDPITEELIDPPLLEPALLMTMTDTLENKYSAYLSGNGDIILSEYTRFDDQTWVSVKFGRCRIENN